MCMTPVENQRVAGALGKPQYESDPNYLARQVKDVGDYARQADSFASFIDQLGSIPVGLTDQEFNQLPGVQVQQQQPATGMAAAVRQGPQYNQQTGQRMDDGGIGIGMQRNQTPPSILDVYRNNTSMNNGQVVSSGLPVGARGANRAGVANQAGGLLDTLPDNYMLGGAGPSLGRDDFYRTYKPGEFAQLDDQTARGIAPGASFYDQVRGMDDRGYGEFLTGIIRSFGGDGGGVADVLAQHSLDRLIGYSPKLRGVESANLNEQASTPPPSGRGAAAAPEVQAQGAPTGDPGQLSAGGQITDPFAQPVSRGARSVGGSGNNRITRWRA